MISSGGKDGGSTASGVFPSRFTSCSGGGVIGPCARALGPHSNAATLATNPSFDNLNLNTDLIIASMRSHAPAQPAHSLLHETHPRLCLTSIPASATISKFVDNAKKAARFFVTGRVQGVGFRFFAVAEAERLGLSGYVRNLRDGRVEAYAIGAPEQLAQFRARLEDGPRLSSVKFVAEEAADIDSQFASGFVTTPTI